MQAWRARGLSSFGIGWRGRCTSAAKDLGLCRHQELGVYVRVVSHMTILQGRLCGIKDQLDIGKSREGTLVLGLNVANCHSLLKDTKVAVIWILKTVLKTILKTILKMILKTILNTILKAIILEWMMWNPRSDSAKLAVESTRKS